MELHSFQYLIHSTLVLIFAPIFYTKNTCSYDLIYKSLHFGFACGFYQVKRLLTVLKE